MDFRQLLAFTSAVTGAVDAYAIVTKVAVTVALVAAFMAMATIPAAMEKNTTDAAATTGSTMTLWNGVPVCFSGMASTVMRVRPLAGSPMVHMVNSSSLSLADLACTAATNVRQTT